MKFIVIGLGNFGSTLGLRLVEDGHEVIGVDENLSIVNLLQDKLTHAICMDATDEMAIQRLPLTDTDVVIISIG
ncbi:MAG: NAD-binding protein, partial [Phaeodactylibacter sp.]|nr:NAD-binding protein [Phaeodactylibacter sp.]